MEQGIDHVVHAVVDLDRAAHAYEAFGFVVTPRADHPWGTANRLVQVAGSYVELLAVPRPDRLGPPQPGAYDFGGFNRRFLASGGPGLSMVVAATDDATAAKARFDGSGIGGFDLLEFSRPATLPTGETVDVSFSLAFASAAPLRSIGFFACHQRTPELVWRPEYMDHPNRARRLASVVLVGDPTRRVVAFLEAFTGSAPVHGKDAVEFALGRQHLELMTRPRFEARFGAFPPSPRIPPTLGAVVFEASGPTRSSALAGTCVALTAARKRGAAGVSF